MRSLKVFFCSRDHNYPRSRVIINGLKKNGVEVTEWNLLNTPQFLSRFVKLIKKHKDCNVMMLGFPGGRYYFPPAKLLGLFNRKPLIFDALISEYETYVFDRKIVTEKSVRSKFYFYSDKIPCIMSDIVLLDTNEQIDYFVNTFNIPREKFRRIFIGTDDEVFYPREQIKKHEDDPFLVTFYGSFIPAHGIQHIIKAAKLLEKYKDIKFEILGSGQTYNSIINLSRMLRTNNVIFKENINYTELPNFITRGNACLGIFGNTAKAKRAIPNKIYEILAMGKPLITGNSPAIKEGGIIDRKNALLVEMGNSETIANAILDLKDNEELRNKIAENGYRLFKENFTPKIIGKDMKKVLQEVIS